MTHRIRNFRQTDLKAFTQLYATIFPDKKITVAKVQKILKTEPAHVILAEEGATLIGFLYCWQIKDECEIIDIGVRKNFRRRGVAQRLLKRLFAQCRDKGIKRVRLEVNATNEPALHLYEKAGFRQVGVRYGYYSDGGNAILMLFKVPQLAL